MANARYNHRQDDIPQIIPVRDFQIKANAISKPQKPYIPFSEKKSLLEKRDGYCFRTFLSHNDDISELIEECPVDEETTLGMLLIEITPKNASLVYIPFTNITFGNIEEAAFNLFEDKYMWAPLLDRKLDNYIEKGPFVGNKTKSAIKSSVQGRNISDFSMDILLLPPVYDGYGLEMELYRPNNMILEDLYCTKFNNHARISVTPSKRLLDYLYHSLIEHGQESNGERTLTSAMHSLFDRGNPIEPRYKKTRMTDQHPERYLLNHLGALKKTITPR